MKMNISICSMAFLTLAEESKSRISEMVDKNPFLPLGILIAATIFICAKQKAYRDKYGTELMSRWMGMFLLFGQMMIAAGAIMMIRDMSVSVRSLPPAENLYGYIGCIVAGTVVAVLSCFRILRRYRGLQALAMIFRLNIVGWAVYLIFSWIIAWLFIRFLIRFCTPRKKYLIIEE